MNFLAHLHLAEPTAAGWIGSLAPDLLDRAALRACHPALLPGVEQHRRIDAFTDTHPIFLRSRARLAATHGRYAGILTDLFYDHVLARDWAMYDPRPLEAFAAQVHAALAAEAHMMPPLMREAAARMHEERWLESYATLDGLERVLARMQRRLSARFNRAVRLSGATAELARLNGAWTADFAAFYPQLRARCGGSVEEEQPLADLVDHLRGPQAVPLREVEVDQAGAGDA